MFAYQPENRLLDDAQFESLPRPDTSQRSYSPYVWCNPACSAATCKLHELCGSPFGLGGVGDGSIWQWNNVPKHTLRWASRFKVTAVLCALLAVGRRIN